MRHQRAAEIALAPPDVRRCPSPSSRAAGSLASRNQAANELATCRRGGVQLTGSNAVKEQPSQGGAFFGPGTAHLAIEAIYQRMLNDTAN